MKNYIYESIVNPKLIIFLEAEKNKYIPIRLDDEKIKTINDILFKITKGDVEYDSNTDYDFISKDKIRKLLEEEMASYKNCGYHKDDLVLKIQSETTIRTLKQLLEEELDMGEYEAFEKRIKELRIKEGLTMEQFAECIPSVTKSAVNQWENGNVIPRPHILWLIANTFDISLDYLLGVIDIPLVPSTLEPKREKAKVDW